MERENLRRVLAFAILEELGTHQLTIPNVDRYVLPKRTKYRINMSENDKACEHDLIPTDIRPHTKDPKRMILILVCRKCYGHQYKTSKKIEREKIKNE